MLADGLKGLAHGVLAEEIERLKKGLLDARDRAARLSRDSEWLMQSTEQAHRETERLQAEVDAWKAKAERLKADVERWKRVHDVQLAAKTRARLENAELRGGLIKIANNRHDGVRVGGVGGCHDNCRTCVAVEALRLADAAGAPRDTDSTGQKVVTADGRLADVCFDGIVRLAKPALVVIESPYAGDVEANVAYARAALLDSLRRGEAPLASHLLYTQVLDDQEPELRALGISAGFAWNRHADKVAVYQGRGISDGMRQGIALAERLGIEVEFREVVVDERAPLLFSDETVQHDGRGVGYAPTTTPEPERTWSGVLGGAIHHETAGGIVIPDDATVTEEG